MASPHSREVKTTNGSSKSPLSQTEFPLLDHCNDDGDGIHSKHHHSRRGNRRRPPGLNVRTQMKPTTKGIVKCLNDMVEGLKSDINDLTNGHLNIENVNKTLRPKSRERASDVRWLSADPKRKGPVVFDNNTGTVLLAMKPLPAGSTSGTVREKASPMKKKGSKNKLSDIAVDQNREKSFWTQEFRQTFDMMLPPVSTSGEGSEKRKFLCSHHVNITRADQYSRLLTIDRDIIECEQRTGSIGLCLRMQHLDTLLNTRLAAANGNAAKELAAYSTVFEYLLNEYHVFGPLLRSIKNEFDLHVAALSLPSDELQEDQGSVGPEQEDANALLNSLRRQVNELRSSDETRISMKRERNRIKTLEAQLVELANENSRLITELHEEKLLVAEQQRKSEVLDDRNARTSNIIVRESNEPAASSPLHPTSGTLNLPDKADYSAEIEELHEDISRHIDMIGKLKTEQREKFVPVAVHDWLRKSLSNTETDMASAFDEHRLLTAELESLQQTADEVRLLGDMEYEVASEIAKRIQDILTIKSKESEISDEKNSTNV